MDSGFMDSVWGELRPLLRRLVRRPGLSLVVIAVVAAGIALTTALLSVAQATLLAPLPARDADRLVALTSTFEGQPRQRLSPYEVRLHAERSDVFDTIGVWVEDQHIALTGSGPAENLLLGFADSGFFRTLGVPPLVGRTFEPHEDRGEDTHPVAVLSHALWRRRFGGEREAMGASLELAGRAYTVVGVLPADFPFEGADVWLPVTMSGAYFGVGITDDEHTWYHHFWAVARLADGVTPASAAEAADRVAEEIRREHPWAQRERGVHLEPLRELLYGRVTRPLRVLLLGAALLLLVCAVNVAALLLLRAHGRQREVALSLALGASRRRIAGLLVAESLLLTGTGGVVGIAAAGGLTRISVAVFDLGLPSFTEIALVPEVLAAAFALVLLTGLFTGLVPALRLAKTDPRAVLGSAARDTAPLRSRRQRGVLVAAEVAIAVVLLVGAGLTARSFVRLLGTELGWVSEHLVTARINQKVGPYRAPADPEGYASDDVWFEVFERRGHLLEAVSNRLAAVPETSAVAFWSPNMLGEADKGTVDTLVPEPLDPQVLENWLAAHSHRVSPGALGLAGIPVLRGREFTLADRQGAPRVAMVSERAAQRLWPGEDPIGKRFHTWWDTLEDGTEVTRAWTVVGLAAEALHRGRRAAGGESYFVGDVYFPYYQVPPSAVSILVRTRARPEPVAAALRRVVAEVDPNVAVYDVRTMRERLARREAVPRFAATLMGGFATMAALLAFVGTYGILAFSVRQRTAEIAVRSALGAPGGAILALVYRQGMVPVVLGVVTGLGGAWALSRWLESLLFGVEPADPLTYAGMTLFVLVAASLACLAPARQAARVEPSRVLRGE